MPPKSCTQVIRPTYRSFTLLVRDPSNIHIATCGFEKVFLRYRGAPDRKTRHRNLFRVIFLDPLCATQDSSVRRKGVSHGNVSATTWELRLYIASALPIDDVPPSNLLLTIHWPASCDCGCIVTPDSARKSGRRRRVWWCEVPSLGRISISRFC